MKVIFHSNFPGFQVIQNNNEKIIAPCTINKGSYKFERIPHPLQGTEAITNRNGESDNNWIAIETNNNTVIGIAEKVLKSHDSPYLDHHRVELEGNKNPYPEIYIDPDFSSECKNK